MRLRERDPVSAEHPDAGVDMSAVHHVSFTLNVKIPDGLYVPLEEPLTERELELAGFDSWIAASELGVYLREKLSAIGVALDSMGTFDIWTVPDVDSEVVLG